MQARGRGNFSICHSGYESQEQDVGLCGPPLSLRLPCTYVENWAASVAATDGLFTGWAEVFDGKALTYSVLVLEDQGGPSVANGHVSQQCDEPAPINSPNAAERERNTAAVT